MANNINECSLNVPDPNEDDGLLHFSQYYFKEWSEVEGLYKLTMYNESLDEKAEMSSSESEDSDMEKDSSDENEEYIDELGNALDNMMLSGQNVIYRNPMDEPSCYGDFETHSYGNNQEPPNHGWIWKSEEMENDDPSSDDESSSLSD